MDESQLRRVRAVLALGGICWYDIEDAVQQVQLKWLEHAANNNSPPLRNPSAWLSAVASNVARDWHRSVGRESRLRDRLEARWSYVELNSPPEDDRILALTVAGVLDDLPRHQRQVLVLRYYTDLTVSQIAELLAVPEGTVKSRLHHALAAASQRLQPDSDEEMSNGSTCS